MACVFTIDVEDWFHILDMPTAPSIEDWPSMPPRVENNFRRILNLLNQSNVKATCFFLGWIAEKYPDLVREASNLGHEIGSHGYSHRLANKLSQEEFYRDAKKSKEIIENISGEPVNGYRAAGFSVTDKTPWFFEALARAGYKYDSSVFPAWRGHGGMITKSLAPHKTGVGDNDIIEIPISVTRLMGTRFCFFGGGYLRLFPYKVISSMSKKVMRDNRPVIFYIHPRDIDSGQPRLKMNRIRRFKSYINLKSTEAKIEKLLAEFEWLTCRQLIDGKQYNNDA